VPLTAKRAGSLFEVPWRDASGHPYLTQSRSILEVRVSLSFSCADDKTRSKLAADWARFKEDNKQDAEQHYSATVEMNTTLGCVSQFEGRRAFALSSVPSWLNGDLYGAFRLCCLGWFYRLWYSTQNGVIEMHLHRELKWSGIGGDHTRETDRNLYLEKR
jgi:hypothetical protein